MTVDWMVPGNKRVTSKNKPKRSPKSPPRKVVNQNTAYDKIGGGGIKLNGVVQDHLPIAPQKSHITSGVSGGGGQQSGLSALMDFIGGAAQNLASLGGTGSGASGGGGSRGSGGSGGGGSSGSVGPELAAPAFTDPYAPIRNALNAAYNGKDGQGIQAILDKITAGANTAVQGYNADAQAQSQAANAQMQSQYTAADAQRKASMDAMMNDLASQHAASGALAAEGAAGGNRLQGQALASQQLNSRLGQVEGQQAADRQAMIANTGQFQKGAAASAYAKTLSGLDMQTAAAKAAFDQQLADAVASASGGGGGGGGGRRGGGGGGSSSASGDGTYQDTMTRTQFDRNQSVDSSSQANSDEYQLMNSSAWQAADEGTQNAARMYVLAKNNPALSEAMGVDLAALNKRYPNALDIYMHTQGPNQYGYGQETSTSTDKSSNTRTNTSSYTDQTVSKYTSPKVKGGPPTPQSVIGSLPFIGKKKKTVAKKTTASGKKAWVW
jgi:hypothetical protein